MCNGDVNLRTTPYFTVFYLNRVQIHVVIETVKLYEWNGELFC